ncbi:fasciclin-3 isoform X8 [Linepithema humile]|uniref:fasciclin-3 isoform X8 n=1 Tax=Linepithema humile TaxID=83485 RepID=UPI00062383AE|nr:PREDICTED: fasciclin-3 isoform X6 [Linepithema humile]
MCMQASSNLKMTTFTSWVYVFFVLCASIVKATSPAVDIEPKMETVVRIDQELKVLCKTERPLRVCRVEMPNMNTAIVLSQGDVEGDIEYHGDGWHAGQCGIRIKKVQRKHNGIFKCFLTTDNVRHEANATLNIIVAEAPTANDVALLLSRSNTRGTQGYYRKEDNLEISCKASKGRPAANVSLYLDDELINSDRTTVFNDSGDYISMRNASRILDWTDHNKKIRCVVSHTGLEDPLVKERTLSVEYAPLAHKSFERFGYVIGRQGIINVTVFANPMPKFTWNINGETIEVGTYDKTQRFQTSSPVELRSGVWSVILTINNVQKSDTENEYKLVASNNEGTSEYYVKLSTSSEPADRSSTRNLGESSDTESAGKYSRSEVDGQSSQGQQKGKFNLSRFFGRNKDKVTSTDTDTMKTVVTVDDEKSAEPTSEGGEIVYAELDLPARELTAQAPSQRNNHKTEYAEILYTKPETEETTAADK